MKYLFLLLLPFCFACLQNKSYDIIIRNGMLYDGNGGKPVAGDIAIEADTIAYRRPISN